MSKTTEQHVVVVGGGIIGLAVGWQLARHGMRISLYERGVIGREASWVAAGMLAPHAEVGFEEADFLRAGVESLRLYRRFLDELAEDSGVRVTLDDRATLWVGFDRDDAARLRRLFEFRQQLGLPVRWLGGSEAREMEPLLSPRVTSAISIPDDSQIDNRQVIEALAAALEQRGGAIHDRTEVTSVDVQDGRATGVGTVNGTERSTAIVIAAGCWSNRIAGIPEAERPPVRPVKGQIVALRTNADTELNHVIRAPDVYLVPKRNDRLIVGATQEEMGFDTTPTAGPLMRLIERGWEAVPAIYDLPVDDIEVGLRPGSRDHHPIVGKSSTEGLFLATGHFRHGILFTPLTAYAIRDAIAGEPENEFSKYMAPARFLSRRGAI